MTDNFSPPQDKRYTTTLDPSSFEQIPARSVSRYVRSWLSDQAGCELEPDTDSPSPPEDVKLRSPHGGTVEDSKVHIEGLENISQQSDSPVLTLDEVTAMMREGGWKIQFVSPEEMDEKMEERSALRRESS
jgi:hypothetical protein